MKLAYPAASQNLSDSLLCLKIARHSPCSICTNCTGLHPSKTVRVVLDAQDESVDDYANLFPGSDDEDDGTPVSLFLELCACGHDAKTHNADETEIGKKEFIRRSNVGIRIDELLKDSGRLLDFEYTDEDINSLRKQMVIPLQRGSRLSSPDHRTASVPLSSPTTSSLSDPDPLQSQPSQRKRRASTSSLSEAEEQEAKDSDEDDSEDEDKPLASRRVGTTAPRFVPGKAKKSAKRSGKPSGGKKAKKSHTAHAANDSNANGKSHNGANGWIKEEKMETVVPAETITRPPPPSVAKTEKMSAVELRRGIIKVDPVRKDLNNPRMLVILTGLKTLFQKQLPNMPREYIARLVYDDNSRCLAIIKKGYKVVGGICFRPFPHRGFAEIVFFATNSADQEKGYGGMLMDHFKAHIRKEYKDIHHFLTYADNYAVGYFEKQGFSKDISLDKSVWAGYIKDYEGSTVMQCALVPRVDYLDKKSTFDKQQEAVLTKIREISTSHVVYPGLPQFQPGQPEGITLDPKDVPGLKETGWSPEMEKDMLNLNLKSPDYALMEKSLNALRESSHSWAFRDPVKLDEVPDYLDVVKTPMGKHFIRIRVIQDQLLTILHRLAHDGTQAHD
ncbi:hypothetical protein FA15DRAFT_593334 [Coprinopsis marcescibilis]|uniref:Uncharacterized protein n=1 Tax=Coprinopsis marcescibilis TaxID=230819 RepID=A0A5C3KTV0_COPMA|nr:hypothetical protein FA15DRAFT_593334 [Coprinopsis marcescibilis]